MTHFIGKFTSAVAYVRYSIILLTVGSGLKTSSLLCRRVLTPSIICLPLFVASRARWKTHFSFAALSRWKTNFSFAGPARPVGKITSYLKARPGKKSSFTDWVRASGQSRVPCTALACIHHLKIYFLRKKKLIFGFFKNVFQSDSLEYTRGIL